MNAVEMKHLTDPGLSHIARSLYALYFRPRLERGVKTVNLGEVAGYLGTSSKAFPTSTDLRVAVLALTELESAGFIARQSPDVSWEGCEPEYPYFASELALIPSRPFQLTSKWRPGPAFGDACLACGLENPAYTDKELAAFIAYWSSKPEARPQAGWERAFAQRLMKSREARVARVKQSPAAPGKDARGAPLAKKSARSPFTASSGGEGKEEIVTSSPARPRLF